MLLLLLSCSQEKLTVVFVWHEAGVKQPAGWRIYAQAHRMPSPGVWAADAHRLVGAMQIWPLPNPGSSLTDAQKTLQPGAETYNNREYEFLPPVDSTNRPKRPGQHEYPEFNVPEFSSQLGKAARYKAFEKATTAFKKAHSYRLEARDEKGQELLGGWRTAGGDF
jgi:hypothetical protein